MNNSSTSALASSGLTLDPGMLAAGLGTFVSNLLPALVLWIAIQLAAEVVLWVIVHVLKPLTAHTKTNLDDCIVDSLPTPVRVSALMLGFWAFCQAAFPNAHPFGFMWGQWLAGVLIFGAGMVLSGIANALVLWYYQELAPSLSTRRGGAALQITKDVFPMVRRIVVWIVYFITAVAIMGQFGIDIGPILAGLGVAGLAVGLALQDTLANFFSGLQVLSDKPVKIGEFVALDGEDGKIKGFVEEVGWRTTRIRTRGNYTYYVPNKTMCNSLIVNFSRGQDDNWKGSSMSVGVDYSADPAQVREIILTTIKRLQQTDNRFAPQEPSVRLDEFGESALVFKAMWTVRDFAQNEMVAGTVREEVLHALRANKIDIPYPIRTLRWEGAGSAPKAGRHKK